MLSWSSPIPREGKREQRSFANTIGKSPEPQPHVDLEIGLLADDRLFCLRLLTASLCDGYDHFLLGSAWNGTVVEGRWQTW